MVARYPKATIVSLHVVLMNDSRPKIRPQSLALNSVFSMGTSIGRL